MKIITGTGARLPVRQSPAAPGQIPRRTLRPHGRNAVVLTVSWANWCRPDPGPLSLWRRLPGPGGALAVGFGGPPDYDYVPRCSQPGSPSTSTVLGLSYLPGS